MIRNVLTAAALAALALGTAACNTVDGLGDDIKSVGQAGKRAID
ncbi:MAG TPA: Entericidin EcnA/B family protein [Erythrobacter sp.]|nr:Entericidin EcnA/B family protein [Erythrobacter colymbi]